jgi:hypothetical protein
VSRRPPFHPFDEVYDRGLGQLTMASNLKDGSNSKLDIVDGLVGSRLDTGRFEMQTASFERDMPTLIEKVRHEKADGTQFGAFALVNISPGQLAKALREAGRCRSRKVENLMEFLAFLWSKKRREWPQIGPINLNFCHDSPTL